MIIEGKPIRHTRLVVSKGSIEVLPKNKMFLFESEIIIIKDPDNRNTNIRVNEVFDTKGYFLGQISTNDFDLLVQSEQEET